MQAALQLDALVVSDKLMSHALRVAEHLVVVELPKSMVEVQNDLE